MSCVCFRRPKIRPAGDLQVATLNHQTNHRKSLNEHGFKAKLVTKARANRVIFRMVGLTIIPIIVLIALNIVFVRDSITAKESMKSLKVRIKSSMEDFGSLIHRLQIERGTTALYISSGSKDILTKLRGHYLTTNQAIANVSLWNAGPSLAYFTSKQTFQEHLHHYRVRMDPNSTTLRYNMAFYTEAIDEIIRWFDLSDVQVVTSHTIWSKTVGYEMLVMAKEQNGVGRALGSTFYAMGGFRNNSMYQWFMQENLFGAAFLENSMFYSKFVRDKYNENMKSNGHLLSSIRSMEEVIKENNYENLVDSWKTGDFWFEQMTKYINILFAMQLELGDEILSDFDDSIDALNREAIVSIILMVGVLLISPVILHAIVVQTQSIQHFSANLEEKTRDLEVERVRSDRLLHQMLPPSIAMELKSGGTVHAEFYDQATVFFSDVVNFTRMCAESTPMQVVEMLNLLYNSLDCLIEQFDAYKVETIGDAYMVASGIPRRNGNKHAAEIALMSLAIVNLLRKLKIPHIPQKHYVLRIGIHTGPCAAGVVGKTMPRYCLFGDTVNTASRMESTSEAYRIHISEATQRTLENHEAFQEIFTTTPRGKVDVKGKGVMSTYWLESNDPSSDLNNFKSCVNRVINRSGS